jgi:predicted ATPase
MGSSPHVGLLWAVEKLAWSDDLVDRVVEVLAKLSDRDRDNPNARMANRPIASLRNVLHPIMPQSCTTVEQRLLFLDRVLERFPEVGWPLTLSMTTQLEMFLESQRPQWLEWVRGSLPAKGSQCSEEEWQQQVTESVGLLLRHAGKSAAHWADLVQLTSQNPEFRDRILDVLVEQFPSELDTDGDVWAALRDAAHWRLSREDEVPEQQEGWKRFLDAYQSYTPSDPVRRIAWLFAPMVDLPDFAGDHHEEESERARRRVQAVDAVLDSEEGWKKLEALAGVVEAPHLIGEALATSRFAEAAEAHLLRERVEPLGRVLTRLLAARETEKGMGWFEEALAGLVLNERFKEAAEAALFVTGVDRSVLWDMIDRLGDSLRQEYWRRFAPYGRYAITEGERAIRELLHVEREADAVVVADQREDRLPDETVLLVLERLQKAIEGRRVKVVGNPMLDYHVGRLSAQLDRSTTLDVARVAKLEFFILLALGEQTPSSRLFLLLEESAEEFVGLVTTLYRAAGEAKNDALDERNRRAAKAAYRVLEAWKGYPGRTANPEEVQAKAESWARESLVQLGAKDRARGGAREVARVLARAPVGPDGIWPGAAARKLLESDEFPDLSEELVHAQFNRRGVVTRRVAEGGAQERELAARYRAWSRETRSEWPETSRVLATLADAYERMAEEEDVRAVALRRELDEPDAPAPGRTSLLADYREHGVRAEDASEKVDQVLSLRIGNERCVEKLELVLGGLAVLIGENGSGKSSIIEACEILRRATTDEFLRELQSIHGGLQGLLRRGANVLKLGVTIGHSEQPDRHLDYDIHLAPTGDGAPVIISERVIRSKTGEVIAQGQGSVRRRVTAPGDEIARVLDALKNIEVHLPFEVTAAWAARAHKRESVIRNATPLVVPERCEVFGSNLVSVYQHLRTRLGQGHWSDTMGFLRLGLGNDLEDVLTTVDASGNSMALALKWRGQDAPVHAFALADGVLSYLGFVAIARLPRPDRSLLVFDEPDLHLHPQLVTRVLHLLEEESESTTVLLATQSDRLLDALSDPVQSTRVCELSGKERVTVVRELDKEALDDWLQDYRGLGDLRAAGYLDAALGQADKS